MAFRSSAYLKPILRGSSAFATSTSPKMKPYVPAADFPHFQDTNPRKVKGDMVPVYVALGLILMSTGFGLYTGIHQLRRAPNVHVKKSRRETLPEVVEPERAVEEADRFIKKSFFRKVAHVQDFELGLGIPHPIRGEVIARYIYIYIYTCIHTRAYQLTDEIFVVCFAESRVQRH
ncbi:hypothetical protein LguiB_008113 [Lonicera macranthoides]